MPTMAANLAALMPAPSKAASISCRLASGVRTRPRLSCLRISPADNNDAVDVIASRLRHLHYLRQVVLRATLTVHGSIRCANGPEPKQKLPKWACQIIAFFLPISACWDHLPCSRLLAAPYGPSAMCFLAHVQSARLCPSVKSMVNSSPTTPRSWVAENHHQRLIIGQDCPSFSHPRCSNPNPRA